MMGREVFHLLNKDLFDPVGYLGNDRAESGQLPLPLLGGDEKLDELSAEGVDAACLAIGNPELREVLFNKVKSRGLAMPVIIHSSAVLLTAADKFGEGTIVYPNSVVMNDCRIGRAVLVNSGSQVAHDVVIGDFVNLNPGVSLGGKVEIGDGAFIGLGSSIRDSVRIGEKAVVGMGSVVTKDVQSDATVYGVPATKIN
jgi:sugar O-acyltransferase (sialic acid O-acetyltransferase NeuD family)